MNKRRVSTYFAVLMTICMLLMSSINVQALSETSIDGSYLTHDDESIGYDTKISRGEDLLTGYSKCVRLGPGKIYAGGTTIAAHNVKQVKIAVIVERAQEGDTHWEFYASWEKENANADRVGSNRTLEVEGDYYYRVRCIHSANGDVSSSFTNGVYIENP